MNSIIDGIDYGPLAQLIGMWSGKKGVDTSPDINANVDVSQFTDELTFTASGAAENAEEQELVSVKYHHVVKRAESGLIFHDQIGHWIYEPSTNMIMHSLSIPRGVCVLAGGVFEHSDEEDIFNVEAQSDNNTFGIVQSPFMMKKAKTKKFEMTMRVKGDELSYRQIMSLHIYGTDFEHTDQSVLNRVAYDID